MDFLPAIFGSSSQKYTSSAWPDWLEKAARTYLDQANARYAGYEPTRQAATSTLTNMLSGRPDVGAVNTYFNKAVYTPAQQNLNDVVLPGIRNTSRNMWSTARTSMEDKARQNFSTEMNANLAGLQYKELQAARENALKALQIQPEYDPRNDIMKLLGMKPQDTSVVPGSPGLLF